MQCDDWKAFHQDYVNGILSDAARGAVDRHLSDCAACFGDVRTLKRIDAGLREMTAPEPPPGLVARAVERAHPAIRKSFRRELVRLAAAAAIVASAVIAAWTYAPVDQVKPIADASQSIFEAARDEISKYLTF